MWCKITIMSSFNNPTKLDKIFLRLELRFRVKYPYFITNLFKLSERYYAIYIANNAEYSLEELTEEISLMQVMWAENLTVRVLHNEPENYLCTLEPLSLQDCLDVNLYEPKLEDVARMLVVKYPKLDFGEFEIDRENLRITVPILSSPNNTGDLFPSIEELLNDLGYAFIFECQVSERINPIQYNSSNVFIITPSKSSSTKLPYILEEEEFWFDRATDIYNGRITKVNNPFISDQGTSCYSNFMLDGINIRNHLMLFDTVFVTLPLEDRMSTFLNSQRIQKKEIVELASKGRIKLVLVQPEDRMDMNLIEQVFEANPKAILGRRGVSALCAIDLVELNNKYLFSSPEVLSSLPDIISTLEAVVPQKSRKQILELITWPLRALRESYQVFSNIGTFGFSRLGVNDVLLSLLSNKLGGFQLEFSIFSEPIHIASALNSTYIPFELKDNNFSDYYFARMMGSLINLYKNLNEASVAEHLSGNKLDQNILSLDDIRLFELNDFDSLYSFEDVFSIPSTRRKASSLMGYLSSLSPEERSVAIQKYNTEIEKSQNKKLNAKDSMDIAMDVKDIFLEDGVPGYSLVMRGLDYLNTKGRAKFRSVDTIMEKLEQIGNARVNKKTYQHDRDIDFLSKISRVARIKKNFD